MAVVTATSPSPQTKPILGNHGLLQIRSPDELYEEEARRDREMVEAQDGAFDEVLPRLTGYIREQFEMMRMHRSSNAGWNTRLLHAQRVFNRQYEPDKLADIMKFGGSDIYAGVTATKCRGATSLLREVYLQAEKPWGIDPTPEPTLPDGIQEAITQLVQSEMQTLQEAGQTPDPTQIRDRINGLVESAQRAAKANAKKEAQKAEDKLDDYLVEGGFYETLAEFLVDLPIFPFACMKGPVVRVVDQPKWTKVDGRSVMQTEKIAKMFWQRCSPFSIYFTPGVSDIRDADVIEVNAYTRADLNALLGLPGYDDDKVRGALRDYGANGLKEWLDPTDSERALGENRENPITNNSKLIDVLEFHGNIQGSVLLDWGMSDEDVPDGDVDYFVQAWVVGKYTIKVQLHPSPRKRPPYFITSFEKVPGTPVGNALPDILSDIQDVCNATLRSLVNNMAMSSGPQVALNEDRLVPGDDNDQMYPWKRWRYTNDPFSGASANVPPVQFFQPNSNSQEMMVIYEKFVQIADELSAIPRYTTGSDRIGGAGRTASGLAMLMGNANKILQTVASNIDRDVLQPIIEALYDMMMLTDQEGLLRGDEDIRVRGVEVAVQRETNRARQLELLQNTMNPVDSGIMGPLGRAKLLRAVAREVGLDGEDIIPSEEQLKSQIEQQARQQQEMQAAQMAADAERQPGRAAAKGQVPGPSPANTDLGVQEAAQMRGVGG